jgi:hypothetical protein
LKNFLFNRRRRFEEIPARRLIQKTALKPRKTGLFSKSPFPPLVGERGYLATTYCGTQENFSKKVTRLLFANEIGRFRVEKICFPPVVHGCEQTPCE